MPQLGDAAERPSQSASVYVATASLLHAILVTEGAGAQQCAPATRRNVVAVGLAEAIAVSLYAGLSKR